MLIILSGHVQTAKHHWRAQRVIPIGSIFDQSLQVNLHILYTDSSASFCFGKSKRINIQQRFYKLYVEPHEHDRFLMELMK